MTAGLYRYDAFLSFCAADEPWAREWLLPRLEMAGLRICTEEHFEGGAYQLDEYERLVDSSRHVLLVISPAWLAGSWTYFTGLIGQHDDPANRRRKILPVIVAATALPRRLEGLVSFDFTGRRDRERELKRLLAALHGEDAPAAEPSPPAPLHWTVPFLRNDHFVGRDPDLERLHAALSGETPVGIRPAGLTGQGGIGKTQLAVEYCFRRAADYPDGVFWINAAEDWRQGFAALGRRVDPACEDRPLEQQLRAAVRYLTAHPRSLLVLDNVEDPASLLRPLIPELIPAALPVPTIFTTRRRDLGQFQPVEVTVLPAAAALDLLLSHHSRQPIRDAQHPEHATAHEICAILGYLPLAVEIAAAHLGRNPMQPLTRYRDALFKRGALDVVDDPRGQVRPEDLGTRHAAAVEATLREQFDLLQNEDARLLLRVAGQLSEAAQIPVARLGLLAGVSDADDDFFGSPLQLAVEELVNTSLVESLAGAEVRLHPLVREFAARCTPEEEILAFRRERAACLFDAYSSVLALENNCLHRGVSAVESDVRTALDLVTNRNAATGKPDSLLNEVITRLRDLLRLLERSSHEIRDWDAAAQPAFFAQQIRVRSLPITLNVLYKDALARLTALAQPYLDLAWGTSRAAPALIRTLTGHRSSVLAVAVTPDGKRAVSASSDRTLRVWDLDSGQSIATFTGHEGSVNAVAVTPDGRRAVSASDDHTLRVWDLDSGQPIATLTGHEDSVRSVAVTPDGTRAVSASADRTLRVWNLDSGQSLATLIGHEDWVHAVAVTPDGWSAVSASSDRTLCIWNLDSGQSLVTLTGHESRVTAVAVTPDGWSAVSASLDRTLRVWDLDSGQPIVTLTGHESRVTAVAVTPDGKRAVSASDDRTLRIWNLNSGQPIATFIGYEDRVLSVAVTPDGRRAVSASWDCTLRIWELDSGQPIATLAGHEYRVTAVAVTPDGKRAVSASLDRTLRVWDLDSGQPIATLTAHDGMLSVAVTSNGKRAVSASWDRTLRVWDLDSGQPIATLTGEDTVWSVAVTPDGKCAISASDDHTLRVWDLDSGQPIATLTGHEDSVRSVAVTPDGRRAVSASGDGTLRVWDLDSGQPIATLVGHEDSVLSVAVTPDGRRAVSASAGGTLRVWDLDKGICLAVAALDGSLTAVAVALDGETIVAGAQGGNVYCLRYVEPEPPSNSPRDTATGGGPSTR